MLYSCMDTLHGYPMTKFLFLIFLSINNCATFNYLDFIGPFTRIADDSVEFELKDNDKKKLLLSFRDDGDVLFEIPENIGEKEDINIEEWKDRYIFFDYKNNIQDTRKVLRQIFCKDLSAKKGDRCFNFIGTINSVENFHILVGHTPEFFHLAYNKNKFFICSPSSLTIEECLKKSSRFEHLSIDEKSIGEEFGINVFDFKEISSKEGNPKRKFLFLKLHTSDGVRYFRINYPTLFSTNNNHHETKELTKTLSLNFKTIFLSVFLPIPIALDIVFFPVTIGYLILREYAKGFAH